MSIQNEVLQLSYEVKRSIARFARKLLKDEPNIHTILLEVKQGVEKAKQVTDLELQVFYHTGSKEESCRDFNPGRNYQHGQRTVQPHEACVLASFFPQLHKKKEPEYMKFLEEHGTFFIKKDYLDITTINSTEMEKSDPLFYKLFISHSFKKGYVVYNRLMNPLVTMHLERSED